MDKCFCHLNGYEVKDSNARANIDEILEIIGNLEDLTSNDKTNLVNAINEAMESGGGGNIVSFNLGSSSITDMASYSVTYKEQIGKLITEATENGTIPITLILYATSQWAILRVSKSGTSGSNYNYAMTGIRCYFQSTLDYSYFSFMSYELGINPDTNIVSSCSKKAQYDYKPNKLLTMDNTTSYTPTKDYHPATKKYVDESISSFNGSDVDLSGYYTSSEIDTLLENKVDSTSYSEKITELEEGINNRVQTDEYSTKMEELDNSISQKFDSSNISVLTGTLTIDNANADYTKHINYPTGFTKDNCIPLALGIYSQAFDSIHDSDGYAYAYGKMTNYSDTLALNSGTNAKSLHLYESEILLTFAVGDVGTFSEAMEIPYKIVLMKITS